jgi:hypothetical protein
MGNNCKSAELYHCYFASGWYGEGSEEIEGSWEQQDTTALDIPDSSAGDFVDMEQWVWMDSSGSKWMESGQQGGEFKGCCSLWWFWAMDYGSPTKYYAYVNPPYVWEVAKNHYNNYTRSQLTLQKAYGATTLGKPTRAPNSTTASTVGRSILKMHKRAQRWQTKKCPASQPSN